jgi:pyruvate-formate lyase-activating enzyme
MRLLRKSPANGLRNIYETAAGATRAQVKNLVENADREFEDFKKHLGIN